MNDVLAHDPISEGSACRPPLAAQTVAAVCVLIIVVLVHFSLVTNAEWAYKWPVATGYIRVTPGYECDWYSDLRYTDGAWKLVQEGTASLTRNDVASAAGSDTLASFRIHPWRHGVLAETRFTRRFVLMLSSEQHRLWTSSDVREILSLINDSNCDIPPEMMRDEALARAVRVSDGTIELWAFEGRVLWTGVAVNSVIASTWIGLLLTTILISRTRGDCGPSAQESCIASSQSLRRFDAYYTAVRQMFIVLGIALLSPIAITSLTIASPNMLLIGIIASAGAIGLPLLGGRIVTGAFTRSSKLVSLYVLAGAVSVLTLHLVLGIQRVGIAPQIAAHVLVLGCFMVALITVAAIPPAPKIFEVASR